MAKSFQELNIFIRQLLHRESERNNRGSILTEWNPQDSRRRGGPNSTWRISVHMEAKAAGLNWNGVKAAVKNKVRWRCVVDVLCSK
jgi:hypothetical protein